MFFRTLLFKIFNRISTWQLLTSAAGPGARGRNTTSPATTRSSTSACAAESGSTRRPTSCPPPPLGEARKHRNHLRLAGADDARPGAGPSGRAATMEEAFNVLARLPGHRRLPGLPVPDRPELRAGLGFSEMDFVVPGPGARDGIRKCFGPAAGGIEAEVIRYMADTQEEHFERLGLRVRRAPGPAAPADRLPEPVLRGRQVRTGRTPGGTPGSAAGPGSSRRTAGTRRR